MLPMAIDNGPLVVIFYILMLYICYSTWEVQDNNLYVVYYTIRE